MSEFVYKDYLPANARIVIDYKAKERVKFSYPRRWTYKKAVWKMGYITVFSFWANFHVILIFYLTLYLILPTLIIISIFFPFEQVSEIPTHTEILIFNFITVLKSLIFAGGFLLYIFGIPALATLYLSRDKERLSNWVPKIGYWTACWSLRNKEMTFKPKDIIDNKVIIPNFSNIFLNYECSGDFNKYLEKVEILELPFKYKIRRFWMPFLIKKREKNDYEFRAVFYFSNKIKKGSMKVDFA